MKVELLIEEDCALCEQAREVLESLREDLGLDVTVTDARSDSYLFARHRYDLPVIKLDGRILSQRTAEREEIARRLRHARRLKESQSIEGRLASAQSGRRVVKVSLGDVAGATRPAPPPYASPPAVPQGERRVVKVSLADVAGTASAAPSPVATREEKAKARPREKLPPIDLPHPDARAFYLGGFPGRRTRKALEGIPGIEEVRVGGLSGLVALRGRDDAIALAKERHGRPGEASSPLRALALGLGSLLAGLAAFFPTANPLGWFLPATAALLPLALREARWLLRDRPLVGAYPLVASGAVLLAAAQGAIGAFWAAMPAAVHLLALGALLWARRRILAALAEEDGEEIRATTLVVEEGAVFPVDGRLLSPCVVDETPLAGDEDAERLAGEEVFAGGIARERAEIEVIEGPSRRALARRRLGLALAEGKDETREALRSLLVPLVGLVAGGAAWLLQGPAAGAALLLAFPVPALSFLEPLGRAVSLLRAHADGVAAGSWRVVARAGRVRTVVFGKRGLLERGVPAVLGVRSRKLDPFRLLELAAAAEEGVDHPIARAIVDHARELGRSLPKRARRDFETGAGVEAEIEGEIVHVGSPAFLARKGVDVTAFSGLAQEMGQRGSTPVLVSVGKTAAGVIEIGPFPSDGARQALGSLELREVQLHLATSDHPQRARWLAQALGLDPAQAVGDLSEESEARLLQALDRPVLVAAGRSHLARSSEADLVVGADGGAEALTLPAFLVRPDPRGIAALVRTGQTWRRARSFGLAIAGLAALGAIGLAMGGRLDAVAAVALSLGASLVSLGAALAPWIRLR